MENILDIDKKQIPPIQKKRILAFVNHFLIQTTKFLNNFANECEYKFLEVEKKIQTVEAALVIVEAKLSSIPGIEGPQKPTTSPASSSIDPQTQTLQTTNIEAETQKDVKEEKAEEPTHNVEEEEVKGVKACEDQRYKKFFKMVQFGVPPSAVKQKMSAEGFDSSILDNPNQILEDGSTEPPPETQSDSSD